MILNFKKQHAEQILQEAWRIRKAWKQNQCKHLSCFLQLQVKRFKLHANISKLLILSLFLASSTLLSLQTTDKRILFY